MTFHGDFEFQPDAECPYCGKRLSLEISVRRWHLDDCLAYHHDMRPNSTISIDSKELGNFFRSLRDDRQWSLRKAAEETGIHHATTSGIERGISLPSLECFLSLCKVYDVDVNEIIEASKAGRKKILRKRK